MSQTLAFLGGVVVGIGLTLTAGWWSVPAPPQPDRPLPHRPRAELDWYDGRFW